MYFASEGTTLYVELAQINNVTTESRAGNNRILIVEIYSQDESDVCVVLKKVLEESVFHADSYTEPVFSIREFQASESRSIAFGYQDARYGLLPVLPRNEKDRQQVKVCFLTASEMYYEQFRKEEGFCALDKDRICPKANWK